MRKHVSTRDLSAYLDGQARGARAIQEHLHQCPECARDYAQLEKVRGLLQDRPREQVGPAFAARVMTAVREEARPSEAWVGRRHWALAASAAAVVLCAGLALFALLGGQDGPTPWSAPPEARQPASESDALMLAWLAELDGVNDERGYQDLFFDELAYLEVLLTMAEDPWLEDAAPVYQYETDMDELVETLDEESADIFVELLAAYGEGVWTP